MLLDPGFSRWMYIMIMIVIEGWRWLINILKFPHIECLVIRRCIWHYKVPWDQRRSLLLCLVALRRRWAWVQRGQRICSRPRLLMLLVIIHIWGWSILGLRTFDVHSWGLLWSWLCANCFSWLRLRGLNCAVASAWLGRKVSCLFLIS